MNALRLAMIVMLLSLSLAQSPARATEREISGELVILKTGNRQFRIVDHGGSFTAPAGVSLEDFDGKPVRVELGSGGRVLSITEKHIETNPMMRNYQIVTGQLVVTDAVSGTFTISGDGRPLLAPPGLDVRLYANQMVDVFLDEQGHVKSIDRAKNSSLPAGSVLPNAACTYNGRSYGDGVLLCQSGARYRCDVGLWRSVGGPCVASDDLSCERDGANYASGSTRCDRGAQLLCQEGMWRDLGTACVSDVTINTAPAPARSCIVGDATVASGSTICRNGFTHRCSDGLWNDIGTACR